jgi:hypothetical protein
MLTKTYHVQVINASARAAVGAIYAINIIISVVTLHLDKVKAMGECDEYRIDDHLALGQGIELLNTMR